MATQMASGPTSTGKILVDLSYGRANYATSSTSFACMKVVAPFARASAAKAGRTVSGAGSWTMAGTNATHGGFKRERVEHNTGTIILLQGTRMSGGLPISEGAIFVRLRDTGPLYEVYGRLPTSHQNVIGDSVVIATLRGDLMTLTDLQVAGIEVPRIFRQRFMQAEEITEMLQVSMIQPELKPRPQLVAIATDTGVELQAVAQAPVRRLRFRQEK